MDILKAPFLTDMTRVSEQIYAKGWGEANGGNISIRITPKEMLPFEKSLCVGQEVTLPFAMPDLAGDYFLVTGTGVFFRNIASSPLESLGIVHINPNGETYSVVWGYSTGGRPTSELPSHLLSHVARKKASGGQDTVVLHTHTTNLIALSFVLPLDMATVTRELWEMMSECLVLFPDGIGILDWMLPGQLDIGHETARLMEKHHLVLWAHHGIFGAGKNMDQVFGLIETAEKAAEMLLKVMAAGGKQQAISTEQLKALAKTFNVTPQTGVLD
ncbi:rhamnulose-1-phosphate aldolase [Desulfosediminicola flagellatus]|uniref:rhamnulose-1-phosphate aldolase n=1 Tax=Desulfosediminicola flagellatus TaxID=2569541 RepID=UPI0010ACFE71|nr:rhamnulose-1-phosphate aldolase [Desulfosediminicola flagellatus]